VTIRRTPRIISARPKEVLRHQAPYTHCLCCYARGGPAPRATHRVVRDWMGDLFACEPCAEQELAWVQAFLAQPKEE